MYVPRQFEEQGIEAMHGLIREHPLATLVAMTPLGLDANHIPLHLTARPALFGTLTGHVARSNPIWRDYLPDTEVLAISLPLPITTMLSAIWAISLSRWLDTNTALPSSA